MCIWHISFVSILFNLAFTQFLNKACKNIKNVVRNHIINIKKAKLYVNEYLFFHIKYIFLFKCLGALEITRNANGEIR